MGQLIRAGFCDLPPGYALDAADIGAAIGEGLRQDARRAALEERLSGEIGSFEGGAMADEELAIYGLEKLGHRDADELDDPMTVLEYILADRAIRQDGTSMDSVACRPATFIDRYIEVTK